MAEDVSISNINGLNDFIQTLPAKLTSTLVSELQTLGSELVQKVQDDKLSGGVLNERSGRLKSSIFQNTPSEQGDVVATSVSVAGDVSYAAIQEYGGVTKAHVIEAANGKALAFSWQGKQAFFAHVNHPGSVIPARSYLRSSLEEMQGDIVDEMSRAVADGIGQ